MKIISSEKTNFFSDSNNNIAHIAKEIAYEAVFKNMPINFYWMDKLV